MYTHYTRKHMYTRGAWPTTTKRLTWEEHEAKEANGKRAARNGDGVAGSPQHVQHSLVHVRPSLELLDAGGAFGDDALDSLLRK